MNDVVYLYGHCQLEDRLRIKKETEILVNEYLVKNGIGKGLVYEH